MCDHNFKFFKQSSLQITYVFVLIDILSVLASLLYDILSISIFQLLDKYRLLQGLPTLLKFYVIFNFKSFLIEPKL